MNVEEQNAGAVVGPPETSAAVAADAGEVGNAVQTQEAAAPAVEHAAIDPDSQIVTVAVAEPEPPPDRQLAAEMVTRFLGHQGSKARDEVSDLNDLEAWEVIRAAGDRFTARVQIKSIIGRAYDRRREEAAKRSAEHDKAAAERAAAQRIVETAEGCTAEEAAYKVGAMKPEEVAEMLASAKS